MRRARELTMFLNRIRGSLLCVGRSYGKRAYSTNSSPSLTPFISFSLPSKLSTPCKIMAMLDGDYEDVNPETTMGNLLFAKQIHRFLKHPEHLLNLEEVRSVLLDYLQQLFEQNKQDFEADFIAVMPSSKGEGAESVYTVAKALQEVVGTRTKICNLLLRKQPMEVKTTKLSMATRKKPGAAAAIQFPTLVLNEEFKEALPGSKVIVLDDNLVFGNISEAARNLLVHSGVSEFVFASVCNFGPEYFAQNIELSSDANVFQEVLNSQWKVKAHTWITKPKSDESLWSLPFFLEKYPQYSM